MNSEAEKQGVVRPKRAGSHGNTAHIPRRRADADQQYLQRRHLEGTDSLHTGKSQVMEKFFTPVYSPPLDGMKPQKHRQAPELPHRHRDHGKETHRLGDVDLRSTLTPVQHHHHGYHLQDEQEQLRRRHHNPPHRHHSEDKLDHPSTFILSRASSSSPSSSSSIHSSTEWSSEAGIDDPFSIKHASRPQHTMSCSNIAGGHHFREDDGELQVSATVKHDRNHGGNNPGPHGQAHGRGGNVPNYTELNRGHSRSEEGLLQNAGTEGGKDGTPPSLKQGRLYKTASLGRSLAFSEEILAGPKRAVSSIQLPSKGILKNKEGRLDIRKAKSMEVLSPRVAGETGPKRKPDVEALKNEARQNLVKGKIQFSAFLDEITKQVISPARLNTLGVPVQTVGPGPTKAPAFLKFQPKINPQLPLKKQGDGQAEDREQITKPQALPKKLRNESETPSKKIALPSKFGYESTNYTPCPDSPPACCTSQSYPLHPPHGYEDKPTMLSDFKGPVVDRHGRYGPLLMDGTVSSSPEPSPYKHSRDKHRDQSSRPSHSSPPSPYTQPPQRTPICIHSPLPGPESPSRKSDSPRNRERDTASSSSGQSDRHSWSNDFCRPKPHRALTVDMGELQVLQEENAELHQNLMQTVVCIDNLEAELARTREELHLIKEKFKRLQDTHTGTQHSNSFLGEKLHCATANLSSERKYMLQHIAHLSSELEQANATISSLENINVPCLIKELLEKHFDSGEAVKQFLKNALKTDKPAGDIQSHSQKEEEKASDWAGAGTGEFEAGPQPVTAFMPWQQEGVRVKCQTENEDSRPITPPFSVTDISIAIYNKIAASHAARQAQHASYRPHTDSPCNTHPVVELGAVGRGYTGPAIRGGLGGAGRAAESEQGPVDVSYLSAQRVLDDFMCKLTLPEDDGNEAGGRGH